MSQWDHLLQEKNGIEVKRHARMMKEKIVSTNSNKDDYLVLLWYKTLNAMPFVQHKVYTGLSILNFKRNYKLL